MDTLVTASRWLTTEISARDDVDERLRLLQAAGVDRATGSSRSAVEQARELYAEFRAIAQAMEDEGLRHRLRDACDRLANLGASPEADVPPLPPRELDVLAQMALGCTNAEAGRRLSLSPETVKAYLRSTMRKLDVYSRHEAVVVARRLGVLP